MNEHFSGHTRRSRLNLFHIDGPLLLGLLALLVFGLFILYSASGQDLSMMKAQIVRLGVALAVMVAVAQITPQTLQRWSLPVFVVGLLLLVAVNAALALPKADMPQVPRHTHVPDSAASA